MPEKAWLMPVARNFMPAIAPNAIRATTRAYSTKSWPSSRSIRAFAATYILIIRSFIPDSPFPGLGFQSATGSAWTEASVVQLVLALGLIRSQRLIECYATKGVTFVYFSSLTERTVTYNTKVLLHEV